MPPTAAALNDLTDISSQIEAAVVFDREGTVLGSTVDDERAGRMARTALDLVESAVEVRADAGAEGAEPLAQLDVALRDGSVFVAADNDRLIAATTTPEPTVGLVFYDLKSCLRGIAAEGKPKRVPAKAKPKKKKDEKS